MSNWDMLTQQNIHGDEPFNPCSYHECSQNKDTVASR